MCVCVCVYEYSWDFQNGSAFPIILCGQSGDRPRLTHPCTRRRGRKRKRKDEQRGCFFFKHHLTLTVLADPSHQQTRCLCGGGVRGQTGAEVNKGHKSKMEGERREEEEEEEEQRPVFMCL